MAGTLGNRVLEVPYGIPKCSQRNSLLAKQNLSIDFGQIMSDVKGVSDLSSFQIIHITMKEVCENFNFPTNLP